MSDDPLLAGPARGAGPAGFDDAAVGERRLPCGTESVDLLAQVCDGDSGRRTAHQQQCPYCRALLIDYAELWSPFAELAAEPVRAPLSIVDLALAYVREVAGDSHRPVLPLHDSTPTAGEVAGSADLTARVIMRCVRLAAQEVDGVRLALSHVEVAPPTRTVTVDLTVAVDYGQDLYALAARVRARAADTVRSLTGPGAVTVSVHIDDVFPARTDAATA